MTPSPFVLIILDGFGWRTNKAANAIVAARKPNLDYLLQHTLHTPIQGSGTDVGLPDGQMGNSEVGHLNIGAGRIVQQDLTRIDDAIADNRFNKNEVLVNALQRAKDTKKAVHVLGLLSPGGVHSHESHFHALLDLAAQLEIETVYIHVFLDGRDTPPRSAMSSLDALTLHANKCHTGKIASIVGRYYAMDRDQRWERVAKAYDLLTEGQAPFHAETAQEALHQAYTRGESDEFVQPTAIYADQPVTINDGDVILFMNFRADRARELTQCFIDPNFSGFKRKKTPKLSEFVCLSEYDKRFNIPVAFPPQSLKNILPEYLSAHGFSQLRIAETEKYAHVTFFFNGGQEKAYPLEDRILIPSPRVATYDLQPEMSAYELTDKLVDAIKQKKYAFIVCNFANPDMVGHTGNFAATVKAIEVVDECLGKIVKALQAVGGEAIITADHGNAECMFDNQTNQAHTAHTSEPVPFIYIGRPAKITHHDGKLSDIAPTILYLMGLSIPEEMTGRPLLQLC